ncbi:hypothetical protein PDE_09763 [Penicillium oxalicum 114-2]|uniref:Uncharacterized protein n=1 Tax=Penicillium oxalicum (strain 114-2 / CGMCC 5302) TaxID=933388 RepID=S7ZWH9_PENO1|nr:hypothetical protein PDE_09763 [Penicillium oxalicum 114-2]
MAVAGCRLQDAGCRLWVVGCGLRVAGREWRTAGHPLFLDVINQEHPMHRDPCRPVGPPARSARCVTVAQSRAPWCLALLRRVPPWPIEAALSSHGWIWRPGRISNTIEQQNSTRRASKAQWEMDDTCNCDIALSDLQYRSLGIQASKRPPTTCYPPLGESTSTEKWTVLSMFSGRSCLSRTEMWSTASMQTSHETLSYSATVDHHLEHRISLKLDWRTLSQLDNRGNGLCTLAVHTATVYPVVPKGSHFDWNNSSWEGSEFDWTYIY